MSEEWFGSHDFSSPVGTLWTSWPFWVAVMSVIGNLTSLRAVLTARTAQGAVAWTSMLVGLPLLAVPVYWLFGRGRFRGAVRFRRGANAKLDSLVDRLREDFRDHARNTAEGWPEATVLERLVRFPFLDGDRIELLIDGPELFDSMVHAIDQARHQVVTEFWRHTPASWLRQARIFHA